MGTDDYCFRKNGMDAANKHLSDWCSWRAGGEDRAGGGDQQERGHTRLDGHGRLAPTEELNDTLTSCQTEQTSGTSSLRWCER